ncbi:MAG: hypothetical protein K6G00_01445 [Treponema sp.]|nr:hypothetical protein [Treponema sp.]
MKKHISVLLTVITYLSIFNPLLIFANNSKIDFYTSISEKKADSGIGFSFKGKVDISAIFSQEFKNFEYNISNNQRYGALVRIKKEHFFCDMTLYTGTLRYNGTYSLLKNPRLPASSALATISFLQAGIKPALPSFSSAKRMESSAIKTPLFTGAYFEDGTHSWSIQKTFPHFSVAISEAEFIYGRKLSKSWFQKEHFFSKKKYSSYAAELFLTTADFLEKSAITSHNAIGIVENPFGGLERSFLWARTQNSIKINSLFIQISDFHSWTPLMILPSGNKLGIKSQFVFNPKIIIHPFTNSTFKAGTLLQKTEKVKTSFPHKAYEEYILKSEISYLCRKTKLDIQYSYTNSEKKDKDSYKVKVTASKSFRDFSLKASSGTILTGNKTSFTFSESIFISGKPSASLKLNNSIIYKDGIYDSSKLSCTAGIIFTTKYTKWQGKINISTTF